MRRVLGVLALGMLAACTSSPSAGTAPSSSAATARASGANPSAPATSGSPPQVSCELPYLTTDGRSPFTAVGFLRLPDGVFRPDPAATSALPPGGVQASPIPGGTQPWWDAEARRWVPVGLSSISPDGKTYVYLASDGLHRVDVATGADTLIYGRPQGVLGGQVLAYQADGVYIVFPSAVKNGSGGGITNPSDQVGVWRIDDTSGTAIRIRPSDLVGSMAAGALWITSVTGAALDATLVRIDLHTGEQTVWFTEPGRMIQFLGVDVSGSPIVWTFADGHLEIWHITGPNQATNLYSLDYTGAPHIFGPEMQQGLLVADQNGVWFGASDGLYLYDSAGFRQVAVTSGIPAGPCR